MRTILLTLLCGATLLAPMRADAHEFWIEPEAMRVEPGALLGVTLRHGERHRGETVARDDRWIARFDAAGAGGDQPVRGRDGGARSFLRPLGRGDLTLVFESTARRQRMAPEAFEAYLAEEGLCGALAERRRRGEQDEPGRERYIRCAKTLVAVGSPDAARADAPVGLPVEIVLEAASRDGIRARVLRDGRALEGARVVAARRDDPSDLRVVFTDAEGVARFAADAPGVWMLTTLHMERTVEEDADWVSYWSSLLFEVAS